MTRAALAVAACALASCSRCGPGVPDAGPPLSRRATDLRTAVLSTFPEFRETRVVQGSAVLRRTLVGTPAALEADVAKSFQANGYVPEAKLAGVRTLAATRDLFRLEVEPTARGVEERLSLPVHDGDAARLLSAPISMTTETMAMYFPALSGLNVAGERFEVTLEYEAKPERAHFLVWQLVDLSTRGSWKLGAVPAGFEVARRADGGIGDVPDEVALRLEDSATQARITVDRHGGRVRLEYQLETLSPP